MMFFDKIHAADITVKKPSDFAPENDPTKFNLESAMDIVNWIVGIALDLAVIVGIIMILYSAFLYVSSFGKDEQAETAKKTLLWSIIGTFVVALARIIVDNFDMILK